MSTKRDAVDAAMGVAEDLVEGRLAPADLDRAAAEECRALFGVVVGPADPLWPLHVDIARQALALGALTADEISEWAAVARRRPETVSAVSGTLRPHSGGAESDSATGVDA